jgi:uncharacterized protein YecT (DUF1311 family)
MNLRTLMLAAVAAMAVVPLAVAADPKDPDPGDAAALRQCIAGKGTPKAQRDGCVGLIVKRCFEAVGNDYDSTVRDCNRREEAAWDIILNEEYNALRGKLAEPKKTRLRDEQRAWIRKKDRTCNAIYEEFQGTMAYPLMAQCFNRETSQRAIYLINLPH